MIASHPARLGSSGDWYSFFPLLSVCRETFFPFSLFIFLLYLFFACVTRQVNSRSLSNHTPYRGQRECNVSLRRYFSMILPSTHISSQGLGWPGEQIFRKTSKCAEWRGWTLTFGLQDKVVTARPSLPNRFSDLIRYSNAPWIQTFMDVEVI